MSSVVTIAEAIGTGRCITAIYNRGTVTLAPESLIDKHGELYLRAVRLEFDGRRPRFPKLGTFKLSGLTELSLSMTRCSAPDFVEAGGARR